MPGWNLIIAWLADYAAVVRRCVGARAAAWREAFPARRLCRSKRRSGMRPRCFRAGGRATSSIAPAALARARDPSVAGSITGYYRKDYSRRRARLPQRALVADDEAHAEAARCFHGLPIRQRRTCIWKRSWRRSPPVTASAARNAAETSLNPGAVRQQWGPTTARGGPGVSSSSGLSRTDRIAGSVQYAPPASFRRAGTLRRLARKLSAGRHRDRSNTPCRDRSPGPTGWSM